MPTILRKNGYRFFIPSSDHPPAHVHVEKSGGEAKFRLVPTVELIDSDGMKMKQITEAFVIACQHRDTLLKAWRSLHENK